MRILLLAVWAVLTLVVAALILTSSLNIPAEEEWEFVGVLVGKDPVGAWVWGQRAGERLPLARLLYWAEFRLTRDFRAAMLLQTALVSALALGLMRLAAKLRGRPDWADLFFPISLLHLGHWGNFLLGYQLRFALFLAFATGLVAVALQVRRDTAFRSGVLGGVLLFLAALTGGPGLMLVPPVVAWLGYLAVAMARMEGNGKAAVIAILAFASAVYLVICLVGGAGRSQPGPRIDIRTVLTDVGKGLSAAVGVAL